MTGFVVRRLPQAILVVLAVATLSFVLLKVAPGDPYSGGESFRYLSSDDRARLLAERGLDRPLTVQYLDYLGRLARGDFGQSSFQHRPAGAALRDALGNTMILGIAALMVDFLLGISLGIVQGTRAGSRTDRLISVALLGVYSLPVFVLAALLFEIAIRFHWPVGGTATAWSGARAWSIAALGDRLAHLALPALALGIIEAARTARYQRAEFLEALRQDFIRTARAKGLADRFVLARHALRNALLPTITLAGVAVPALLSGAVLVESVFGWPGLGKLTADSIAARDYDVVTGSAIIAAALVVAGNLAADLLYRVADPRTRTAS